MQLKLCYVVNFSNSMHKPWLLTTW